MAVDVFMPKAGMTMEEGTVINWLKAEGEKVEKGEPLLNIETDKVDMELESPASGYLTKILYNDGATVPVTTTIGYIGESKDDIPDVKPILKENINKDAEQSINYKREDKENLSFVQKREGEKIPATPAAKTYAASKGISLFQAEATGKHGEVRLNDVKRLAATPLARRIAQKSQINLNGITGSGVGGKITKKDVLIHLEKSKETNAENDRRVPITPVRKGVAVRTARTHMEVPPVTLQMDADVTELSELYDKAKSRGKEITYNDLAVYASVKALGLCPEANVSLDGDYIVYHNDINIGVAVAVNGGLVVPVIKKADKLSLGELSKKSKELCSTARKGLLSSEDIKNSTFTVSNLGMYGVKYFTPIINSPNAAILGVCAIRESYKLEMGTLIPRRIMGLCLTFDHRLMDGASAAKFLGEIKNYLESPLELFI